MNSLLSFSSISLIIALLLNVFLATFVYRNDPHKTTNRVFGILGLVTTLWLLLTMIPEIFPQIGARNSLLFIRWSLFFAVPQAFLFFVLARVFPEGKMNINNRVLSLIFIIAASVMALDLSPYVIDKVDLSSGVNQTIPGPAIPIFALFNGIFSLAAIYELIKKIRKNSGVMRQQLYFILSGIIAILGFIIATILLPVILFDNNYFAVLTPLYAFTFLMVISFAIVRYKLFDIRVIATQFLVVSLVLILIFEGLLSQSITVLIYKSIFAILTGMLGVLLAKSVIKEVEQRDEIRKLADELAATNVQLEVSNERLRILDQRKSEFVSIASHQLRTPVTAIKGYTSLLLEDAYGPLTEKIKDPIGKIFHSSERLVLMINDFLNVSKIEQNSMTYTFVPLDLKKMVTELVEDFHVVAGEKKINLATDIPEGENFYVVADEGKIRQIMSNLIDNSIKYTPQGSVRLILSKEPTKGDHGMIHLQIKDTGIGLSQDDIHHLFGKFTRGAEGSKVNTSGSGLGLYVAKQMMEKHQGNIWVDSEGKGKGSVFSIELPEFHGELPK